MGLFKSRPTDKREFVKQQILCGKFGVVRNAVKVRIVPIQILVQALHDVGDCEDVGDFRLRSISLRESIHLA